jgi:hypothetical protein
MSEPYLDDDRNCRAPEGEYAEELLLLPGPPMLVWCEDCDQNTPHFDYCDEDGANRVLACDCCRRIAKFYPVLR